MDALLDFGKPFDVGLLDRIVAVMSGASSKPEERAQVGGIT
jgi:hypothetical protein